MIKLNENNDRIIYMKFNEEGVAVIDDSPEKTLKQKVMDNFGKNNFAKGIINDLFNFGSEDDKEIRELLKKYSGNEIIGEYTQ